MMVARRFALIQATDGSVPEAAALSGTSVSAAEVYWRSKCVGWLLVPRPWPSRPRFGAHQ